MSFAAPARPVVGDKRVQQALDRQEKRGKDPDVNRVLARHLAAGRGLSAQVVNKYNSGKYSDGRSTLPLTFGSFSSHDKLDERFGRGSAANIAGLQGAELDKGDVYMGATKIESPRVTRQTPNGGESVVDPGSSRYDITVLPRWMVQGQAAPAAAAPSSPSSSGFVEPDARLLATREAFDRASARLDGGTSSTSSVTAPDLTKGGGDLFFEIRSAADSSLEDYDRRFIPSLIAGANLASSEIGYATRDAIARLPADLKIPEYPKMFPDRASRKGGLYKWLEGRIA